MLINHVKNSEYAHFGMHISYRKSTSITNMVIEKYSKNQTIYAIGSQLNDDENEEAEPVPASEVPD